MQEGLEDVTGLGDRDDAGGARVVDAVVEVVHAARVHDLLAADVRAGQLPDARPELCHRPATEVSCQAGGTHKASLPHRALFSSPMACVQCPWC